MSLSANSFSSFAVDSPVFLSVFNKNSNTKQNNLSSLYLLRQSIFSCFLVLCFNSSNCLYNSKSLSIGHQLLLTVIKPQDNLF
jgi:hypothetical protein